MKYRTIEKDGARFPVRLMCRCLEVSPAGFYAWRERPESAHREANKRLLMFVTVTHAQSRQTTGPPRIHASLASGRGRGRTPSDGTA